MTEAKINYMNLYIGVLIKGKRQNRVLVKSTATRVRLGEIQIHNLPCKLFNPFVPQFSYLQKKKAKYDISHEIFIEIKR